MGWKIIKIEKDCLLNLYLNNLQITNPDNSKIFIPINDIDTLLIDNTKLRLSINLINKLSTNNVNIVLCDDKHIPSTLINPINGNSQSHKVFINQLKWSKKFREKTWNWISKIKCENQLNILEILDLQTNDWINKLNFIDFNTSNAESQIANLFFNQIFTNKFNRQSNCEINYIFNYGYTIITSMVSRSIISKGLNPHISFFHGSNISEFPLAYDIVEIFRTIIDYFVIQLFREKIISFDDKKLDRNIKTMILDYISNVKILLDGKKQYLNNSIDTIIDWIINDEYDNHKIDCLTLLVNNEIKNENHEW